MAENKPGAPKLERLSLDLSDNTHFQYRSEKVGVYPNTKSGSSLSLSETNPAKFKVTPDSSGGGRGIMIWMHESVPLKFREIILHHELTESDLILHQRMNESEAHKSAAASHKKYAKQFLSEADYQEFLAWEATLNYNH